jgi:poly-gamma-glutamate capsule biosynthesis protein CapA/YwtB (metallophosphatase superfamily)
MRARAVLAMALVVCGLGACTGSDPGVPVPREERSPTANASTSGDPEPQADERDEPRRTTLLVVGDIMLTRGVPDPARALAPMTPLLRRADLTVGNLESTLSTNGAPTQGGDSFGGSPAMLGPLTRAGFDALSLANNHSGDYGELALLESVATLRESRIVPFGAGRDVSIASQPALLQVSGTTFAFLGFNAIGETPVAGQGQAGALSVRMPPRTGPLVRADLRRVTTAIRRADRVADVVVVLPHWGEQYTHVPDPAQRLVARALVQAGADLVVGGHPHWVQGVDSVAGVPVAHSLGNFVFDMDFATETMEGVVLEATFRGSELRRIRFVPYRMDAGTFAPRVVDGADILADLRSTSTGPYARPGFYD